MPSKLGKQAASTSGCLGGVGQGGMFCRKLSWLSTTILLAMCAPFAAALESEPLSVNITPPTVRMGAFYNGATVHLQGKTAPSCGVLVVIRGDERDEFFNRKARVGPIWINSDKIHVAAVPSIFLTFSNTPVDSLLDRHHIDAYQLDEKAIKSRLTCRRHCKCSTTKHAGNSGMSSCTGVPPEPAYAELIRSSYIDLKHRAGNYQVHPQAIRLAAAAEDNTSYDLSFEWPKSAPPGNYPVEVYACRNGAVLARTTAVIQVIEVGFPAELAALAETHPLTYGVIAVLAAVLAGFAIDAVTARFRRPSRHALPARAAAKS